MIVDGRAFSWYGTHIAKCENYFKELLAEIDSAQIDLNRKTS
jgi:hypothetical protein